MKTILLDTSIDYTSWDINEAGSIEMTEWQPIDTAPKDGTGIIVFYYPKAGMAFAFWDGEDFLEVSVASGIVGVAKQCSPTHWCPLPAPPKKGDE